MIMFFFFMFSAVFITLGVILYIMNIIVGNSNDNYPSNRNKDNLKICLLITSKSKHKNLVLLFESILNQTHKVSMKDVYVITENNDISNELSEKYNANYYVKKWDTPKRKGYLLDELIKNIINTKKNYDMYFILDENMTLDDKYIEKMIDSYKKGYDIGIGYRANKDKCSSITQICSGLFTTTFNSITNNIRTKKSLNITLLDSGYFINGDLIEILNGFPFHSLNDDYELTIYSTINNFKTGYNKEAIYYDKQIDKLKNSIIERAKKIKGYLFVRHKYKKKLQKLIKRDYYNYGSVFNIYITLTPLTLIFFGILLAFMTSIFSSIYFIATSVQEFRLYLFIAFLIILTVYTLLTIYTIIILIIQGKKINLSLSNKIKLVFLYPLYLLTYINAYIKSYFISNV